MYLIFFYDIKYIFTDILYLKCICVFYGQGNEDRHRSYKFSESSSTTPPPPPPLVGSVEERCNMALQHVIEGLQCLKYFEGDQPSNNQVCIAYLSIKLLRSNYLF